METRRCFDVFLKPQGKFPAGMWCEGGVQIAFLLGEEFDEEKARASFEVMMNDMEEANRLAKEGNIPALMELWEKRRRTMPASSEQWL